MSFLGLVLMVLISFLVCRIHHRITFKAVLTPIKKLVVKTKKEWRDIDE